MDDDKLKISWDDLRSQQVEDRLRAQEQIGSTKAHYEQAKVVAPAAKTSGLKTFLYSAIFYLAAFAMAGAVLGWGAGELLSLRPSAQAEARSLINELEALDRAAAKGRYDPVVAQQTRARFIERYKDNPYFAVHVDESLLPEQKQQKTVAAMKLDRAHDLTANIMFFGVSGVFIAIALASADRLMDRNWNGALVSAAIGAVAGLVGGCVVALLAQRLSEMITGGVDQASTPRMLMLASGLNWLLLGAFLAAAPGVALRSAKRTLIGVAGGAIGGLVGGLLFAPIEAATDSPSAARLVGLLAIGACTGVAMGLLESAAKQGWLRVVEGLIAGKQFILYRNPTYVGSAAMSHIYLFRDPQVGRRHAAIHHVPGGYEIENLPLGAPTFVNDRPVARQRLRHNDRIRVGRTLFVFQEKH
ncbi:MAG: FHA domain-containing protein [Tepidisphaeraceae bacterium]